MDPRDVFNETLELFDIKVVDLAKNAGISPQMISRYRNKHKDMNSLTLFKLINALPPTARAYFSSRLAVGVEVGDSLAVV